MRVGNDDLLLSQRGTFSIAGSPRQHVAEREGNLCSGENAILNRHSLW